MLPGRTKSTAAISTAKTHTEIFASVAEIVARNRRNAIRQPAFAELFAWISRGGVRALRLAKERRLYRHVFKTARYSSPKFLRARAVEPEIDGD